MEKKLPVDHKVSNILRKSNAELTISERIKSISNSLTSGNRSRKYIVQDSDTISPPVNSAAASGEGSCHSTCAIIPLDKRPLISQAYGSSDFSSVDPEPVVLPMLDDDGRLRLPMLDTVKKAKQ